MVVVMVMAKRANFLLLEEQRDSKKWNKVSQTNTNGDDRNISVI